MIASQLPVESRFCASGRLVRTVSVLASSRSRARAARPAPAGHVRIAVVADPHHAAVLRRVRSPAPTAHLERVERPSACDLPDRGLGQRALGSPARAAKACWRPQPDRRDGLLSALLSRPLPPQTKYDGACESASLRPASRRAYPTSAGSNSGTGRRRTRPRTGRVTARRHESWGTPGS